MFFCTLPILFSAASGCPFCFPHCLPTTSLCLSISILKFSAFSPEIGPFCIKYLSPFSLNSKFNQGEKFLFSRSRLRVYIVVACLSSLACLAMLILTSRFSLTSRRLILVSGSSSSGIFCTHFKSVRAPVFLLCFEFFGLRCRLTRKRIEVLLVNVFAFTPLYYSFRSEPQILSCVIRRDCVVLM